MLRTTLLLGTIVLLTGLSVAGLAASAGTTAAPPGSPVGPSWPGTTGQPATAAGPADIHDIRHPVQVGVNPAIYYWPAGAAAALVIGVLVWLLIRRWLQRRRGTVSEVTAALYKNPEEEALEGLEALEKNRPDQPAMFYFGLSAIFRNYLQRRFDVGAPEMTTEELLPRLSALDFDRQTQAGLKSFLKFGDQVKFARATAGLADMKAHLALVREVVTRFTAPAQPPAGAGGET